jgi:hypothetical protein
MERKEDAAKDFPGDILDCFSPIWIGKGQPITRDNRWSVTENTFRCDKFN